MDYASILAYLQNTVPTISTAWTDWLQSDTGVAILGGQTALCDLIRFYLDRQAAETYITDVQLREDCSKILALIGYQMRNPVPLITTLAFSLGAPLANPVLIPKFTICSVTGRNSVYFATAQDTVIPPAQTTVSVTGFQGTIVTANTISTGLADQVISLPELNIAEGIFQVRVAGVVYTNAENNSFVGAASSDLVYIYANNPDGTVSIIFGDGIEGNIPLSGTAIEIDYLVTLGPSISIGKGQVNGIVSNIFDSLSNPVNNIFVINTDSPTGAEDYEDVATARANFPSVFKTLDRLVTTADFQAFASSFPGVAQALVLDANTSVTNPIPPFETLIYYVPVGGGDSPALGAQLLAAMQSKAPNSQFLDVENADYESITVTASIYVLASAVQATVLAAVTTTIQNFFSILRPSEGAQVFVGTKVFLSQLSAAIQNTPGVFSVDLLLNGLSSDVAVDQNLMPSLGPLSVNILGVV